MGRTRALNVQAALPRWAGLGSCICDDENKNHNNSDKVHIELVATQQVTVTSRRINQIMNKTTNTRQTKCKPDRGGSA